MNDIEILEKLIEKYDLVSEMIINPTELWQDERDAIENLINRVKELEKQVKKYSIEAQQYFDITIEQALKYDNDIEKNYISKDKIKEKMEQLNKEINRLQEENNELKLQLQYALNENNKDILKLWRKKK